MGCGALCPPGRTPRRHAFAAYTAASPARKEGRKATAVMNDVGSLLLAEGILVFMTRSEAGAVLGGEGGGWSGLMGGRDAWNAPRADHKSNANARLA